MKKIVLSAAALALFAGSAFASVPLGGTVQSFNPQTRVIVFEGGKSVTVPLHVAIPASLTTGSHASVDFNDDSGEVNAVFTR